MEVDNSIQIIDWEVVQLSKSRKLTEELTHDGPIIFYDDYVTFHCDNYQRDSSNLYLQHVSIKGK